MFYLLSVMHPRTRRHLDTRYSCRVWLETFVPSARWSVMARVRLNYTVLGLWVFRVYKTLEPITRKPLFYLFSASEEPSLEDGSG
jgi:hypothetical protein